MDFGSITVDTDMYAKLLKRDKDLLILSCGTGREMQKFSSFCTHISGVDCSRGMLEKARSKKYNCPVKFFEQDMTSFDTGEKYDYIIIPYNGILHLLSSEELEKCFLCVKKHLKKGGRFLFDFFFPNNSVKKDGKTVMFDYHRYDSVLKKDITRSLCI